MKIRNGFVSNSSSSSFIIKKKDISGLQLLIIRNHENFAKNLGLECPEDFWHIDEDETEIRGETSMDNFDMSELFELLEVPNDVIEWD